MILRWLLLTLSATTLVGCVWPTPKPVHYDLRIDNGLVFDGTTRAGRIRSLGITKGRISALSTPDHATATRVIDARGLWVTPGFIDPHTHALGDLKHPDRHQNLNYLTQGVTTVFVGNDGDGVADVDAVLAGLEATGIGTNVGFFAGHGQIRRVVMGMADRSASDSELVHMRERVVNAMQRGALGLSTGLYYAPGSFADVDEVVALAKVAATYGGVYDTHLRDEGTGSIGLLGAVDEALEIGRRASIAVHISHIKALGADAWGQSRAVIERVEQAREGGQAVTANQYPWRASGTRFSNALIPRWVMADSKAAMRERLSDPTLRDTIREQMQTNLVRRGGPAAMLISDPRSPHRGKTLTEVAAEQDLPVLDAAIEMVLGIDPSIASFVMDPDDIAAFASKDWVMTGSDGSRGHPRKYATYPKAYADFVVRDGLLTTAQFIHRSSGRVADTFGLCDRGYLRVGRRADLAIIDPRTFLPIATYASPQQLSTGVRYVLINGEFALDQGKPSNALHGRVIRRNALRCAND